jgi:hypothetical protein
VSLPEQPVIHVHPVGTHAAVEALVWALVAASRHIDARGGCTAASLLRQVAVVVSRGGGAVSLLACVPEDVADVTETLAMPEASLSRKFSSLAERWDVPEAQLRLALTRVGGSFNDASPDVARIAWGDE